jgi:hypothetical protein
MEESIEELELTIDSVSFVKVALISVKEQKSRTHFFLP